MEKTNNDAGKKQPASSNKSIFIVIGAAVLAVLAVLIVCLLVSGGNNEDRIRRDLANIGSEFYEKYYYVEISKDTDKRNDVLSRYSDIGIKVDLENLANYNSGEFKNTIDTFKNGDTPCNPKSTRAVIYPKSPYGQSDYKVEVELDCGFEAEK